MAGELATDVAILLGIGSATIGASGAVVAQIVAGVITGKREQRKADAEAARWKVEADAKRRDRQLDRKVELFGKFLSISEELQKSELWKIQGDSALHAKQLAAIRQLWTMSEEIGILAPEVYEHAQSACNSANMAVMTHVIMDSPNKQDEKGDWVSDVSNARASLMIWTRTFRQVTRSYVSHEPVMPHSDAVIAHDKLLKSMLEKP